MTKSQQITSKDRSRSRSFITMTNDHGFQLDNLPQTAVRDSSLPEIMHDNSDETVDSLVMARRMLPSHKPSRMQTTNGQETAATEDMVEESDHERLACSSFKEEQVFISPVKVSKAKVEFFNSPQVFVKGDAASATPGKSPNGVMEGPYGDDCMQYGNDSMDLEALTESPVKTHRRTKSSDADPSSTRRRSRVTIDKEDKTDSAVISSPRRSSRLTRAPGLQGRSSASGRVLASPRTPEMATKTSKLQALQAGEQCIVFPNFQDSFISTASSTDAGPSMPFHDSAFSSSQGESLRLSRESTDSEDEHIFHSHKEQRPVSPSARRSSPVRRRSSRLMRASPTQRSTQQQAQTLASATDFVVAASPRRTNSHRTSKRPPTSPTRTSRKVQPQLQQPIAPVTRYEMERQQTHATDLFAEIKSSAADRRRRRHSSIEQVILKQKCTSSGHEASVFEQASKETMNDLFNDSFTELICWRRAGVEY
ncbi:hypothetical protein MPSEU_000733700 [Mayamaea pseudoterrestris]|nr:hypothetical protein MPSEU_000733700 [Mayamaea pseudoterrestris]